MVPHIQYHLGSILYIVIRYILYEWKIKEPKKHLKLIAVCRDTTLPRKTGKISRSAKVLNNKYDPCAMAVYREHGPGNERINVGHIPIELSSTLRFFVKHGGNISRKVSKVRQKNYRASNLDKVVLKSLLLETFRF